ncbi:deoxynucleotidyltransferase terminal-interacting protein 2 [Pelodytes ibericus]
MVATRRGTIVEPQEDKGGGGAEDPSGQPAMEVSTPASQIRTRNRVKRDSQSEDTGIQHLESTGTNVSAEPLDVAKIGTPVVTRSRRRSGQSDGDVSEADSTTSSHSTRMSRSRQTAGYFTESARKLRSRRSVLVTEPILESTEDVELSEAESNCSSVSTRASKRLTVARSRLSTTRSCRPVFETDDIIEVKDDTEVSEAESNCSNTSGAQSLRATRSTRSRKTRAQFMQSPISEAPADDISEAESCSSGISKWPIARRASRRNKSKLEEGDEIPTKTTTDGIQEVKMSPRSKSRSCGVTVSEPVFYEKSPETESKPLSSPRRSLRIRPTGQSDVTIVSETFIKDTEVEDGEKSCEDDGVVTPVNNLFPSPSKKSELQSMVDIPESIDLTGESADEMVDAEPQSAEPRVGSKVTASPIDDAENISSPISPAGARNIDTVSPQSSSALVDERNQAHHVDTTLLLDSDDSTDSEPSDAEDGAMEEENENHDPPAESGRTSSQSSEDVLGDGLFVIDTKPGLDSSKKFYVDHDEMMEEEEEEEPAQSSDDEFIDEDDDDAILNKPKSGFSLSSSIDTGLKLKDLGGLYISFDASKPNQAQSLLQKMKRAPKKTDELLKNSVITPDFEKKECVPSDREKVKLLKKQRKEEKHKTSGRGWFDMKAPELTDELKNDLKALKMRSAMDPKRFYKKNDREGFPKYFQVGTVVDSPVDFYHSRIPKKERKRTIVEELLADAEFRRYNKRKYQEIIAEKAARAEGKKNRKKKTFRK